MYKHFLYPGFVLAIISVQTFLVAADEPKEYKRHTLSEILTILEESDISYVGEVGGKFKCTNLTPMPKPLPDINSLASVKTMEDGSLSLFIHKPSNEIFKILKKAKEVLKQGKFEECLGFLKQALDLDPDYFKTCSNLGRTYYLMKDYDQAEKHLLKGVQLNEVGFQEHLFLADNYLATGQKQKAVDAITRAYMFHKHSKHVQKSLNEILEENDLQIRPERFTFSFQIKRINSRKCKIMYTENLNWLGLASCLACWEMEPSFKKHLKDKKYRLKARLHMYKEAIFCQIEATHCQIEATEKSKDDRPDIPLKELILYDAVMEDGFLYPILYWEILANEHPSLILQLPKEEHDRIVDYIKKYVYEKKSTKE